MLKIRHILGMDRELLRLWSFAQRSYRPSDMPYKVLLILLRAN